MSENTNAMIDHFINVHNAITCHVKDKYIGKACKIRRCDTNCDGGVRRICEIPNKLYKETICGTALWRQSFALGGSMSYNAYIQPKDVMEKTIIPFNCLSDEYGSHSNFYMFILSCFLPDEHKTIVLVIKLESINESTWCNVYPRTHDPSGCNGIVEHFIEII